VAFSCSTRGISERIVLLSGASGMLGEAIARTLKRQGMTILKLVRREVHASDEIHWNPVAGGGISELDRLQGLSAAIHLSGANVSTHRWTNRYKSEMTQSRVDSTRVLAEALAQLRTPPKVLVSASATGFYGDRGDEILDEDSVAGEGFFPELCVAWEAASRPAEQAGIRVVHTRFGVAIGADGGMLARLKPLFRMGLGGRLGDGKQWLSWISQEDLVAGVLFAVGNAELSGPVNVVAPEPVTNSEFTRQLARAVHRPAVLPAPAFALRLVFGEMADEALLSSTRAVPRSLLAAGFRFAHPTIQDALAAALKSS
jgi:uncharacterized protein (TIGR01777 family)